MQITDVKVKKVESENRMKAVASVTFDDAFVVHDIKVIVPTDKPAFIAMPSRRKPKGGWTDIAHPINSATRSFIQEAILAKYEEVLNEESAEASVEE